jgi:predicted nucleic acid-binding protein
MPYRTVAAEALELWREAERRMTNLPPDSPEWLNACLEAEDARQRYNDAVVAADAQNAPAPPLDEASAAQG